MKSFFGTLLVLSILASCAYCARFRKPINKGQPTIDLKDSRWVIQKDKDHTKAAGRKAIFTGVEFDMSRNIDHQEKEYRVYYGGIVGMEKTMKYSGEKSLYYRILTDGKRVIKMVYAGTKGLVDCEVEKDKTALDNFLADFLLVDIKWVSQLRKDRTPIDVSILIGSTEFLAGNVSYQLLENRIPHEPYGALSDIETAHEHCVRLHHSIRRNLKSKGVQVELFKKMSQSDRKVEDKNEQHAPDFISRRVKRVKKAATSEHTRVRRDLIVPDTRWCGAGSDTDTYEEVGPNRGTDRCCRAHDHCPYYISGFSTNYNYFNFYFHTVSHCFCDEEFRTCLRSVGTSKAEMVGEVYFDILGMKCFEFETEEVCTERSFWGSCTTYEEQVVAKIRGSLDWD